jgi:hypothetical protein
MTVLIMYKNKWLYAFFAFFLLLNLLFIHSAFAQERDHHGLLDARYHWTFLGGYGITHKGFGATETRVESTDMILQYGYLITEERGKSWYKWRHELLIELPFYYVQHPESAIMTGINFLANWNFTASDKLVPYVSVGGGPMYTNLDIPGLGRELNGNYQAGVGIHYFIEKYMSIDINYRFHHISNASTADPNEPLNSSKILFGVSFFK